MGIDEIRALEETPCPKCGSAVLPRYNFCPSCGAPLKPKPVNMSLLKQIAIYAVSIFLPPLGLWPGIKYVRNDDQKVHLVGLFAIILTAASTIIAVWYGYLLFQEFNETVRLQMDQLNELQRMQQNPNF